MLRRTFKALMVCLDETITPKELMSGNAESLPMLLIQHLSTWLAYATR